MHSCATDSNHLWTYSQNITTGSTIIQRQNINWRENLFLKHRKICYITNNLNITNVPLFSTHEYTKKHIINKYHKYNTKTLESLRTLLTYWIVWPVWGSSEEKALHKQGSCSSNDQLCRWQAHGFQTLHHSLPQTVHWGSLLVPDDCQNCHPMIQAHRIERQHLLRIQKI